MVQFCLSDLKLVTSSLDLFRRMSLLEGVLSNRSQNGAGVMTAAYLFTLSPKLNHEAGKDFLQGLPQVGLILPEDRGNVAKVKR